VSLPQSSSSSRLTGGAAGFFDLIQSRERPERLGQAKALAHGPLEAELAGVAENDIAALDDVFISIARPRRLYGPACALLERRAAQVFAAEFKQVEGEQYGRI
jgi:hypothetical protein